MARLALRFISGKYKGGEYILPEREEIYIGRSSDIDLVLMEDMVSRKHARLWLSEGQVHIEDLGSTNGTFVNGEKISKATVSKGDRILIGTSIMKVVETESDGKNQAIGAAAGAARGQPSGVRATVHSSRSMTGTINEVPLPDLIQLFSTSKKTGTLVVARENRVGKIHLEQGHLVSASLSDATNLPPLKAIFRILSWEEGTFELVGPEPYPPETAMNMPTEHILMEGLRQLDELRHMQKKLPPLESELVVVTPLASRLADLTSEELDVFQLIYNFGTLDAVFNHATINDLDVANIVLRLIKDSYIAKV